MMNIRWEAFRETLFGLFYLLTEQNSDQLKSTNRSVFLRYVMYVIDAGQVMRAITMPELGWTANIGQFVNNFDFLTAIVSSIPHPNTPAILAFSIAVGLVSLLMANVAFIIHIFQKGTTTKLWPVMMLRFLMMMLVTTFFVSTLGYLLYPINCSLRENSLTDYILGDDVTCSPWSFPIVLITIPSLILVAIFSCFALVSSLLSLEVNPMSQIHGDCYTGRVETIWTVVRISLVLMRYIQSWITPVGALIFLLLQVLVLVVYHIKTLPFNNHEFNLLRGGIYMSLLWLMLSSFISLSNSANPESFETGQWILLAVTPLMFLLGAFLCERKKRAALENIKRLRREFSNQSNAWSDRLVAGRMASKDETRAKKSNPYAEFFDRNSSALRAFDTVRAAHLAVRVLLYEKDERDIPFIAFILRQGLEEHPQSKELIVLDLVYLRFVFRDKHAAIWQERVTKMENNDVYIDLKYTLYAADKKGFQQDAGSSLGKEGISAVNLMEFSGKMSHARKMHLECVVLFKDIWKISLKSKRNISFAMAKELSESFEKASDAATHTQQCYEELLEKFPGSASLRLDYASFCDVILNDCVKADHHLHKAQLLETGEAVGEEGERLDRLEAQTTYKTGSLASSTMSFRSAQKQFMNTWSDQVMAEQEKSLKNLNTAILSLGTLLMLVSTCGFLVLEYYLYLDVMHERLSFLERAKNLRSNVFKAVYEMRNIHILANIGALTDDVVADIQNSRSNMQSIALEMRTLQTLNYVSSPSPSVTNFMLAPTISVQKVYPGLHALKSLNATYWDFGNEFITNVDSASQISLEELQDPIYDYATMSLGKRSIVFLYQNIYTMSTSVRSLLDLILNETEMVRDITGNVIYSLLSMQSLLIAIISLCVLRYVSSVFPSCQHRTVCSKLTDGLPVLLLRKAYKFYLKCEKDMLSIEDEMAAREELENDTEIVPNPDIDDIVSFRKQAASKTQSLTESRHSDNFEVALVDPQEEPENELPDRQDSHRASEARLYSTDEMIRTVNVSAENFGYSSDAPPSALEPPVTRASVREASSVQRVHDEPNRYGANPAPLTIANLQTHALTDRSKDDSETKNSLSLPSGSFAEVGSWSHSRDPSHRSLLKQDLNNTEPIDGTEEDNRIVGEGGKLLQNKNPRLPFRGVVDQASALEGNVDRRLQVYPPSFGGSFLSLAFSSARSKPGESSVDEKFSMQNISRVPFDSVEIFESDSNYVDKWKTWSRAVISHDILKRIREVKMLGGYDSGLGIGIESSTSNGEILRRKGKEVEKKVQHSNDSSDCYGFVPYGASISRSMNQLFSSCHRVVRILTCRRTSHPDEVDISLADNIDLATNASLAWYFRGSIYMLLFVLIMVLCFCVWLVPTRTIPDLVNTALLVRQVRNVSGDTMATIFAIQEMVLNDGFSRMTPATALTRIAYSQNDFIQSLNRFRLGGSDQVYTGADNINSPYMAVYGEGMYEEGCPWRINATNCTGPGDSTDAEHGLYKVLMSFYKALDVVQSKYGQGGPDGVISVPGNAYYKIAFNATRAELLTTDPDLRAILQGQGDDILNGLDWIEGLIGLYQGDLFAQMQQESDVLLSVYVLMVIGVFYLIVFRTAIYQARKELSRTRVFVNSIPVQVLSREEATCIKEYFVGSDSEEADGDTVDRDDGDLPADQDPAASHLHLEV